MCHSGNNNRKAGRLHEKYLRIIYNNKRSSFNELLEKDSSVFTHEKSVQILTTEMCKARNNFSPSHKNEIFEVRNEHYHDLIQISLFFRPLVISVYHGTENLL